MNFTERVGSFVETMVNYVNSDFQNVSPEIYTERLKVCEKCEHYSGMNCAICGCLMGIKAHIAVAACPIGKWAAHGGSGVPSSQLTGATTAVPCGGCGNKKTAP